MSESGEITLEVMQIQYPLEEKVEHLQLTVDDLMYRLHDAEKKIECLQYRLDQILKETRENATARKKASARSTKKHPRLKRGEIYLDSILPLDLVSLSAFAEDHAIPWSAVTKAVKDYELFPERGVWMDGAPSKWRVMSVAAQRSTTCFIRMGSLSAAMSVRINGGSRSDRQLG